MENREKTLGQSQPAIKIIKKDSQETPPEAKNQHQKKTNDKSQDWIKMIRKNREKKQYYQERVRQEFLKQEKKEQKTLLNSICKSAKNTREFRIEAHNITYIPPEISRLECLEVLYWQNNERVISLPPELYESKSIKKLVISAHNTSHLCPDIDKFKNINFLIIDHNKIEFFPSNIKNFKKLYSLEIKRNLFKIQFDDICEIESLKELIIIDNSYYLITSNIKNLKQLTKVIFNQNDLRSLPLEINQLQNLTHLDLNTNKLTTLPAEIGQLQNLTHLDLSNNNLTELPAEIGQLQNLTYLDLSYNNLTKLPAEIGQLQNLTHLDLRKNNLTELPAEIGQLQNLTKLDLKFNSLTELPVEIGNLTNIKFIDLHKNNISRIPTSLANLENLLFLRITNQSNRKPIMAPQLENLFKSKSKKDNAIARKILFLSLSQISQEYDYMNSSIHHIKYEEAEKIMYLDQPRIYVITGAYKNLEKSIFFKKSDLGSKNFIVYFNWKKPEEFNPTKKNLSYSSSSTNIEEKKTPQSKSEKSLQNQNIIRTYSPIIIIEEIEESKKNNDESSQSKHFDIVAPGKIDKRAVVINDRSNQSQFRKALLEAYQNKCVITECNLTATLEAAHIIPHHKTGKQGDHVSNGLLLRSDFHKLFDSYLISINPETRKLALSPEVLKSSYHQFQGLKLREPKGKDNKPSQQTLDTHYQIFLERNKLTT